MRSEEDVRLDKLADQMSTFIDGWELDDVICVCASVAAAAIAMSKGTPEEREETLDQITKIMRGCIKRMAQHMAQEGFNDRHH